MATHISIIAAVDRDMGIGKAGSIPWRYKEDIDFFRTVTTMEYAPGAKNAVIMGSKTWFSIPEKFRPLPNRINIVITSQPNKISGARTANSIEQAISDLSSEKLGRIFIIGGANIYKQSLAIANSIYLTRIPESAGCDVFFPLEFKESNDVVLESGARFSLKNTSANERVTHQVYVRE